MLFIYLECNDPDPVHRIANALEARYNAYKPLGASINGKPAVSKYIGFWKFKMYKE